MRILAVGAHPDDLELLCAGTMAKYADQGHKVFLAHLCSGNMGGKDIEPEKLAQIRDKEAQKSARIIGAQALGPVAGDLDLYPTKEMRIKLTDIIRDAKPDVIFTHSPNDYMPDHVITSQLVFAASFASTVPLYKTDQPAHEPIVPIFYMDTLAGLGFEPTDYVDITDFFETKKRMFLAHESQYKWIEGHHQADALEMLETAGRFRGLQCGVKYAEAFRRLSVWGRITTEKLLP
ncbi:MAG: PIG-L family deacetylase [Actinobacteria bacterium]|nr:PIG-L family deacetylase [Actinomycetota bacterium]